MENASKALIIAGSILVSIIVISIGVFVFNKFSGITRNKANLDEQEIATFNEMITPYIGNNISGSQVKALASTVRSIDAKSIANNDLQRRINMHLNTNAVIVNVNGNNVQTNMGAIPVNHFYNVNCVFGANGYINEIIVEQLP